MNWKRKELWMVVGLFLLTGVLVNLLRYSRVESERLVSFSSLPLLSGEWKGEEYFFSDQTYQLLQADVSTLTSCTVSA